MPWASPIELCLDESEDSKAPQPEMTLVNVPLGLKF